MVDEVQTIKVSTLTEEQRKKIPRVYLNQEVIPISVLSVNNIELTEQQKTGTLFSPSNDATKNEAQTLLGKLPTDEELMAKNKKSRNAENVVKATVAGIGVSAVTYGIITTAFAAALPSGGISLAIGIPAAIISLLAGGIMSKNVLDYNQNKGNMANSVPANNNSEKTLADSVSKTKKTVTETKTTSETKSSSAQLFKDARNAQNKTGVTTDVQKQWETAYKKALEEAKASGDEKAVKDAQAKLDKFYENNPAYAKSVGVTVSTSTAKIQSAKKPETKVSPSNNNTVVSTTSDSSRTMPTELPKEVQVHLDKAIEAQKQLITIGPGNDPHRRELQTIIDNEFAWAAAAQRKINKASSNNVESPTMPASSETVPVEPPKEVQVHLDKAIAAQKQLITIGPGNDPHRRELQTIIDNEFDWAAVAQRKIDKASSNNVESPTKSENAELSNEAKAHLDKAIWAQKESGHVAPDDESGKRQYQKTIDKELLAWATAKYRKFDRVSNNTVETPEKSKNPERSNEAKAHLDKAIWAQKELGRIAPDDEAGKRQYQETIDKELLAWAFAKFGKND